MKENSEKQPLFAKALFATRRNLMVDAELKVLYTEKKKLDEKSNMAPKNKL